MSLIAVGFLLLVSLHSSPAQTGQKTTSGETVEGVQMAISQTGMVKTGGPSIQVVFRNVSDHDININLGIIGGYSPRPCKLDNRTIACTLNFKLNVTAGDSGTRTYTFRGIAYVGGRIDPYIASLHAKSTYTLELGIDQFWSPATNEYQALALASGTYGLSLEFEGRAPGVFNLDQSDLSKMTFWKGKITSNLLSIDVPLEPPPNKSLDASGVSSPLRQLVCNVVDCRRVNFYEAGSGQELNSG